MNRKTKAGLLAAPVIAALAFGGVALAGGAGDDDATERPIPGSAKDRAGAAALKHVGSGRVTETERAAFANSTNADVVISLHVDGSEDRQPHGVATYYFGALVNGHSAAGERFAGLVQREIVARTDLRDCRTHAKTWELLRYTRMPAVRVELGYVTNPDDAARLGDPDFRDVVAEAIVVAVQRLYLPSELDPPTGALRISQLSP